MANRAIGNNLSDILKRVELKLDGVRDAFLTEMAKDITDMSPVDTGDYIMSHSIGTQSIAGRFTGNIRSIGEGGQDKQMFKETAYNGLVYQIEGLPKDATHIFVGNTAPHANIVEEGGYGWRRDGYQVYYIARKNAGLYLDAAIAKVKGTT